MRESRPAGGILAFAVEFNRIAGIVWAVYVWWPDQQ